MTESRRSPVRSSRDESAARAPFVALVDRQRLLLCVGSGGVGKTTTAATLGLLAARRGRQAAVLTIDPARRLKDSLGIDALGGEPHRVPLEDLGEAHGGSLDAMLLDAKHTFDALIRRYAISEGAAERVLGNRIYHSISTALAGSQEYMAMERLHAIASEGRYDLLVVDTPPTHHALDFLEAPERLTALLSSRAAAILQNPTLILSRESSRLAQAALAAVLRGLERFTGFELLRDVGEFVAGIEGFSSGFQSRAAEVAAFLRERDTAFLLVTTPEPARVGETLAFHQELARAGLPFGGFIVNRVLPADLVREPPPDPAREEGRDAALARKLAAVHQHFGGLVEAERAEIAQLERAAPGVPLIEIPLQIEEPTSLQSLARIAAALDG
ncbi:MAG: ArsA family ATPase [Deltaproteobacteria bacterium]|nr:ArsA family ATPase [Deltaproteobacteria bacterium]